MPEQLIRALETARQRIRASCGRRSGRRAPWWRSGRAPPPRPADAAAALTARAPRGAVRGRAGRDGAGVRRRAHAGLRRLGHRRDRRGAGGRRRSPARGRPCGRARSRRRRLVTRPVVRRRRDGRCPVVPARPRRHAACRPRRGDGVGAGRARRRRARPRPPRRRSRRPRPRWPGGATRGCRRARNPRCWRDGSGGPSRSSTAPSGVAAVAARWWKAGVNLNAKAPSFAASRAVADLRRAGRLGPGRRRHPPDDVARLPAPRRRAGPRRPLFDAVRAATEEIMADVFEVGGRGRGRPRPLLRPRAASASSSRCTWPAAKASTRVPPPPWRRATAVVRLRSRLASGVSSGAPRSSPCPDHRRRTSTRGRTSCRRPRAR